MELMEIVFVMAILLLIFGPKKLPQLARELGEAIYEFKKASSSVAASIESPSIAKNSKDTNGAIEDLAGKLDIRAEGKDIKQITEETIAKTRKVK